MDQTTTSDELLPRYPLHHDSNCFDHEASDRKHARMLSNRVAHEATWIGAVGQHHTNRRFRDNGFVGVQYARTAAARIAGRRKTPSS